MPSPTETQDVLSHVLGSTPSAELTDGRGKLADLLSQAFVCASEHGDQVIAHKLFRTLLNVLSKDPPGLPN